MPLVDEENRVVGMVLREDSETGNYSSCYLVLTMSNHMLRMYPPEAQETMDLSPFSALCELNCQYITKVGTASSRPKVLNCFRIVTTGGEHYFSVNSTDERDEWIETLRQSSMRKGSFKHLTSAPKEKSSDSDGYQTKVVAGVVHRVPIPSEHSDEERGEAELTRLSNLAVREPTGARKTKGYPRILKAGYAIKCGAVMKSWKKRFFVLSEASLGYYKTIEETEPIRSVSIMEMVKSGKSKDYTGKDHLLEVVTLGRTFYIQADNDEEMEDWIKGFSYAISCTKSSPGAQSSALTSLSPSEALTSSNDSGSAVPEHNPVSPTGSRGPQTVSSSEQQRPSPRLHRRRDISPEPGAQLVPQPENYASSRSAAAAVGGLGTLV